MMQALAEGFTILKNAHYKLDLKKVAHIYNHGSVIESRLTKWLEDALELYGPDLQGVSGKVDYSGEGEWTALTAKELGIKAKIIEESFKFRVESQKNPDYIGKVVSALRNMFGGHKVVDENG
jgi:6-phosphogluconate dehydrogenase